MCRHPDLGSPEALIARDEESGEEDRPFLPRFLLQEINFAHSPYEGVFHNRPSLLVNLLCRSDWLRLRGVAETECAILPVRELAAFPRCSACEHLRSGELPSARRFLLAPVLLDEFTWQPVPVPWSGSLGRADSPCSGRTNNIYDSDSDRWKLRRESDAEWSQSSAWPGVRACSYRPLSGRQAGPSDIILEALTEFLIPARRRPLVCRDRPRTPALANAAGGAALRNGKDGATAAVVSTEHKVAFVPRNKQLPTSQYFPATTSQCNFPQNWVTRFLASPATANNEDFQKTAWEYRRCAQCGPDDVASTDGGVMHHMEQKHGGKFLLADRVGQLRWLNRQACVHRGTVRSRRCRRFNSCVDSLVDGSARSHD